MVRRLVPFGARRGSFAVDLVLALHGLDADIDFSFGLPLPCGLLELSRNKDCLGVLSSPVLRIGFTWERIDRLKNSIFILFNVYCSITTQG